MVSVSIVRPLMTKEQIEKSFRPHIPVESFVKEKVEPVIIAKPNVGTRWGAKSDFEIIAAKYKSYRSTVTFAPWLIYENDVKDFTEQYRTHITGDVLIQREPTPEDIAEYEEWVKTVTVIPALDTSSIIKLEEMRTWTFDSGITYETPNSTVSNYFEFKMQLQIPFIDGRKKIYGIRGNEPPGEPIIPRVKSFDERRAERESGRKTVE